MKKLITSLILILIFFAFAFFVSQWNKSRTVLAVISPTKISVNMESNRKNTNEVILCINGVDSFSIDSNNETIKYYNEAFGLTRDEVISLGYLAQEFTLKTLLNQKITIKETGKSTNECKYVNIYLNGINYNKILLNSGFGLLKGKIDNQKNFDENLKKARNLNLVVLNHHSNKYHKLDCPYGEIAHDKIIIPQSQLPEDSIPCKYCHDKINNDKNIPHNKELQAIPNIAQPPLFLKRNGITVITTDFSKKLKPDLGCTNPACQELLNLIDRTNTSIDMAIYGYKEIPAITQALKKASHRGVKIRFIYDSYYDEDRNYYKDNLIIQNLANEYRSDKTISSTQSNMLMHNKFIIFDKKIVYTGSMNLSPTGTSGYDVNSIVILHSPDIANLYLSEFEQMLSGRFHLSKYKHNSNRKFSLQNSEVEIYFSPKDKTSNRIIELINSARSYIYIPTFLITHTEISNALINAKNRGVDVRIIIDANSITSNNTKHAQLRKNGIMLKTENYAGKMHSKAMIIDDLYFITGSMNFSNSGENKNDENTVIIKDKDIAKLHKDIFLYLWTKIPNKYLEKNAKPESQDSIGSCQDGIDNNFNRRTDKEESYCNI
jgi:phosphatidylserine/phosphatidylglycerophosphate/cardiolipin synthase-like enzyme